MRFVVRGGRGRDHHHPAPRTLQRPITASHRHLGRFRPAGRGDRNYRLRLERTGKDALPPHTLGYVFLPALAAVVIGTFVTVPVGARLAHRMPVPTLKRVLGVVLCVLATKMLFTYSRNSGQGIRSGVGQLHRLPNIGAR